MAKLNYNIHGEGEPLIVLHGLFGSGRNWNSVAKELARHRQVITLDLRNHGDSKHTDTMTYADMAGDIEWLMAELGLHSAALLGHSMGGKVAMAFALSQPKRTDALMVADIAPVEYRFTFTGFIDAMLSLPVDEIRNRGDADEWLREAGIKDDMVRAFLLQSLVRHDGAYAWQLNLPVLQEYMQELASFPSDWPVHHYDGPVRFLAAGESDYLQPRYYPVISELFPEADVRTIEGAGHWLHADKPETFVREVRDFLTEASPASKQ